MPPPADVVSVQPLEAEALDRVHHDANRLLGEPAFKHAVAQSRDQLTKEWMATTPGESEKREELYAEVRALERIIKRVEKLRYVGLKAVSQHRSVA